MAKFPPPNVPYVEAAHKIGKHRPTAIVIMESNTSSESGSALGLANYWHSRSSGISAHYVVDETSVYRCVPDHISSFYTFDDGKGAITIRPCFEPVSYEEDWEDPLLDRVLDQTSDLVADLCLAHRIHPRYLTEHGIERWTRHKWRRRGGIILKVRGAWPSDDFLIDVQMKMARKRHDRGQKTRRKIRDRQHSYEHQESPRSRRKLQGL